MLEAGAQVEKYEVLEHLGGGGFAEVYKARHVHLGTTHALKILRPEHVANEQIRLRFLDEARVQAQLVHPNIARVTDIIVTQGVAGLVMEYLEGRSLAEFIEERQSPANEDEILAIMLPVLDALHFAHERGVVHRDVKPDNIFLAVNVAGQRIPKVLDFGIAKVRGELRKEGRRKSTVGTGMGTEGYASPEQLKNAADVDRRADIFSVGVTLYELATGRLPFERDSNAESLVALMTGEYSIPFGTRQRMPQMSSAIEKALENDRENRFPDCCMLGEALRGSQQRPLAARPPGPEKVPAGGGGKVTASSRASQGGGATASRGSEPAQEDSKKLPAEKVRQAVEQRLVEIQLRRRAAHPEGPAPRETPTNQVVTRTRETKKQSHPDLPVLPIPIGIAKVDRSFLPLFPKNCPIPHVRRLTLTNSKDNQKTIMLKIYQGEADMTAKNELLGTFVFSGYRRRPRGKVKVDVWLNIDTEGTLTLSAKDKDKDSAESIGVHLKLGSQSVAPQLALQTAKESAVGCWQPPASEAQERSSVNADGGTPEPEGSAVARSPRHAQPKPPAAVDYSARLPELRAFIETVRAQRQTTPWFQPGRRRALDRQIAALEDEITFHQRLLGRRTET